VIGTENQTESIPFLSIARSLGDYWSYVEQSGRYAVSPVPDLSVREIDWERDHYLILVTDGITNVLSSNAIATLVEDWKSVRR
jgi:protein phosphatase 1D